MRTVKSSAKPKVGPWRGLSTLIVVSLVAAGCSARRDIEPDKPIGMYDYCVVSEKDTHEYFDRATSILDKSFVVLKENDPRLVDQSIRQRTAVVFVDWSPGFWSTSGWVELKD